MCQVLMSYPWPELTITRKNLMTTSPVSEAGRDGIRLAGLWMTMHMLSNPQNERPAQMMAPHAFPYGSNQAVGLPQKSFRVPEKLRH